MLSVSERFKKAFEQVDKPRKIKAIVTLKNVSYKNDQLFHVEYNSEAISGDTFAIGSTFSNNIKVTIDKVVEGIKQQDQLTYQLGIVVEPNETELADMKSKGYTWDVIEYVPMGTFFVTSYNPDRNENRTIIEASDSMSFLESTYSSNLTYPAYLKDIALDVANKNGLVVDSGSLNRLPQIQIKRPEKVSYRQVLGIIAQYQKGFATFDRQNRLAIRALNDPKYTVSTNNYFLKGLVKEELLYKVDGISCKVEKEDQTTVLQAGKTTGNQIVLENSSMTQIDLNTIFSGLSTLNYYPYSLKWRGNPALEVGDWISLNDIKTNSFKVPNLSYKLTFSGGLTAESSAHTKSISETTVQYRGPLNQKIEDITGWISAAGGFSYTGLDEPQNPKEKDVWFKPNGPDMEMWIFENGKWKLETSTADVRELSEAFEESNKKIKQAEENLEQTKMDLVQNTKDIEQNKLDIEQNIKDTEVAAKQLAADKLILEQTVADLVVANKNLENNKTYIDSVKAQADAMSTKIDNQQTVIDTNNQLANAAKTASDQAVKDVQTANALANEAKSISASAQLDASTAKSNAATAVSDASTAMTNAKNSLDKANSVDQTVQTEVARINGELSSKATQTSLNTLNGTVTNQGTLIYQNKNSISLKADQTTVDTLNSTVSSQGTQINQNKNDIALRATTSTVNTLTGRVNSAESSITVNANNIKSLVTKTDGTNTQLSSLTQDVNGFKQQVVNNYVNVGDLQKLSADSMVQNGTFTGGSLYWSLDSASSISVSTIAPGLRYVRLNGVQTVTYTGGLSLKKGHKYRISFMAYVQNGWTGSNDNTKLRLGDKLDGSLLMDIQITLDTNNQGKWVSFELIYTPPRELTSVNLDLRNSTYNNSYVGYANIMINDVTDVLEVSSNLTQFKQDVNGFQTLVANTYETKDVVSAKVTKVSQDLGTFKVAVSDTYSTKGDLNATNVKVSNLSLTQSKFETTVSETQAALEKKMDNDTYVTASSSSDKSGQWVRFLWTRVPSRYSEVQLSLDIISNGSPDGKIRACRLLVRHKQQNPLGTSNPTLMLDMDNVTNMSTGDIRAVLVGNKDGEGSSIAYYIRMDASYLGYSINPYNRSGNGSVAYVTNGDWVSYPSNANAWDAAYGGSYEKATFIEQQVGNLKLGVVMKGEVVSSINLNPEGIRLQGKLITLDGTSYIANGVIKDSHIENATIQTASIADAAITNAKIANLAVSTAKIAELAVQSGKIADLAVTNAKIANATITTAKIGDLAVTNAKIGDLAVTGAKIANASITEAKIGDASIVNAHIKDATIESAKIKSISAEKITAGTLNAANVNIINLNANNITSGNINGINITGSTVTSQKGSSKIILDGGALSWYTSNGIVGSIYTTEENYENFANWDVYDNGYFSIRGKGTRDGETYMRYGWGELKSIVSGMVSIISKNKYADRSTSLELNNSQVILKAGSGSGSSYRQGQIQVGAYGTSVTGGMTISGGLSVTGSKNAIHQVDGQWYATPAYEMAESYLGDIGSTTTNNDSMVLISIDNLFGRIVNTSLEYQVFVSSYGSGHVWIEKRTQNAFIVRSSEPNTKFAWEIKAKRKGYEQERLVKHSLIA